MPYQFDLRPGHRGFVLLHALWLLLLISLLATVAMRRSRETATDGAAAMAVFHVEMAAESALNIAMHELLISGVQQLQPRLKNIDGAEVTTAVSDAIGLLDLNMADRGTLRRLVTALDLADPDRIVAALIGARPILAYAEIAALDGLTPAHLATLLPHITLFSRLTAPMPDASSEWLVHALGIKRSEQKAVSDMRSSAGRVFRIETTARTKWARSRRLVAEVLITGRRDRPFLIYEWRWHALPASPST